MKRTIVITEKAKLAELIKIKLVEGGMPNELISISKSIPLDYEKIEFFIIDEKVAKRGMKSNFKSILKIRKENKEAQIIILGNDDLTIRMQTKIDGADDYIALQMMTSSLFGDYLNRIIFQN